MERIKLVLISPASHLWRVEPGKRPRMPRVYRFSMLSSLQVAASMPPNVDVRIIDEDVAPVDFDVDVDLVGISFMTFNAPRAYEIANEFRYRKGKPVIFGGYHPTLLPEEAMQHADGICVGDSEPVAPRMIADFQRGRLKPVYYSESFSLEGLPRPRRDLIRRQDYAPVDVVQATRGCWRRCTFCSIAAFHQYKFRTRPVEEVVEELKTLGRYILFMDDNITCDRDYAKELFAAMIPLGKTWFSQSEIMIAHDEELLRLASLSGCRGLFVGFESLSGDRLRSWKKHWNLKRDYLAAVRRLHAAKIAVYAGFIFGGDGDTPDVFPRTLEFLLEANVECLQSTLMTPFPGTPLYDELDQQGRIVDRNWEHYDFGHLVIEPSDMSSEQLLEGFTWIKREFYARRRITGRALRSLRYLNPAVLLRAVLPQNLGYRRKMAVDGTFERGNAFESANAERVALSTTGVPN